MGIREYIIEKLTKNVYANQETKQNEYNQKYLSTSTPLVYTSEADVIPSDMSYSYTFGSPVEHIITNRNQLINQWRDISRFPEVSEAIEEIINEALVFEENEEVPIKLDLDSLDVTEQLKNKIFKSFEKILNLLDFDSKGSELFEQWYIDGVLNLEVIYNNVHITKGIQKIVLLPPFDFFKIKYVEDGSYEYFFQPRFSEMMKRNNYPTMQSMFEIADIRYKPEQITQVTSGKYSTDKQFSISHLHKCMKVVNQLSLIEDSIVISRVTHSGQKRVFYIDTGRLPKAKAEAYINQLAQKHRNQMSYDFSTGTIMNRKKSVSLLEDIWIPRSSDGRGTQIDTIGGDENLQEKIDDLEWFYKRTYRALDVPANRRNSDSTESIFTPNNMDAEREELKFFKSVLRKRKYFNHLFLDLLKKDLLSTKTFALSDWNKLRKNIKVIYKNNNNYAQSKFLNDLETKMSIAQTALDIAEEHKLFSKQWVFKNIMGFTDEEQKNMRDEIDKDPPSQAELEMGSAGGEDDLDTEDY